MPEFRLKVFYSVARQLSFTKASEELFITQPAVTKHIKELESEFETKLFNRSGNKIALTQAGSMLLSYAEQIFALHNELRFELSLLKGKMEGNLRLGASTTIAQYVIPPVLAKFHQNYPELKLVLINGNTAYIEHKLLKNEIDIGIVEGKPSNSDLHYSVFMNDELVVFTSSQNNVIPDAISKEEITSLPMVLRERGSGTLEIIEKKMQQNKINPKNLKVSMFLGSTEAIKSFVKTSNDVGIVSRFAIEQELAQGIFKAIHIRGLNFYRHFYFITPKGPEPTGVCKLFHNFLMRHYNL